MANNFTVQAVTPEGSFFPLAEENNFQDDYFFRDAAELQAITLSQLPSLKLSGWRNEVFEVTEFSVTVVQLRGWFTRSVFKKGKLVHEQKGRRG
jgi:hypothetical protein